jgi:hypothetical protein
MAQQKVFDLKEVTLEYSSNGAATFQLYTDLPGGALAIRLPLGAPSSTGVTLPSTTGIRKTITIPLDGVQATLFYPVITPAGTTQLTLLAGKVLLRPIGLYLDGSLATAEIWQPQPIAPGV